jgi:hypothetical protein
VLYRNYRLYFDNENIVVTNLFGKKNTMKWSDIDKECPISSDTFKVKLDKTIKINPLPSLPDFEPLTSEFLYND